MNVELDPFAAVPADPDDSAPDALIATVDDCRQLASGPTREDWARLRLGVEPVHEALHPLAVRVSVCGARVESRAFTLEWLCRDGWVFGMKPLFNRLLIWAGCTSSPDNTATLHPERLFRHNAATIDAPSNRARDRRPIDDHLGRRLQIVTAIRRGTQ